MSPRRILELMFLVAWAASWLFVISGVAAALSARCG